MTKLLIRELVPECIRELAPYVPGKPTEEVERELKTHAIKLASNENPLGPSPLAVEAAKKLWQTRIVIPMAAAIISARHSRKSIPSPRKTSSSAMAQLN